MKQQSLFAITATLLLLATVGCSLTETKQEISSPVSHYPAHSTDSRTPVLQDRIITIATGDISGVYFPLGQALAGIYERSSSAITGTRITKASIENTQLVAQKKAELGFSTTDALLLVNQQSSAEAKQEHSNLRTITGLYSNYIHIVATRQSGIRSFKDLNGKRIGVGPIGSGTELTTERILQAANLTRYDLKKHYFSFSQSSQALRDGIIDAAFFSSGLPNPDITSLAKDIPLILIPIPESVMKTLEQQSPYYSRKIIPGKTYAGLTDNIQTVAVKNVLLTYSDLPKETVYNLTRDFYEHLPEMYDAHPAAREIKMEDAEQGVYLPLHPGAAQYFDEQRKKK
ncbi:TAXI family TRAP transporter solute-binding subunit [Aneurinibacillus sp. REN35]|uniref:TAXI family TRAP transporter solute-binding subunit n=1 Tax=Aneurinibacillus sp. REN35 TaxID=3237286 RepID=UPI003528EE8B